MSGGFVIDPSDLALGGNIAGGDPNTWQPALWDFLIARFGIRTMLDVGAGEGHCVEWFAQHGVAAEGFDGLAANCRQSVATVYLHDLRRSPYIRPVDLVHCCEVVEHIEERYLGNLLDTLANGRVIALTHALPGQVGHHHVNCQPPVYWVEHLEGRGYRYLVGETARARHAVVDAGWTYFAQSGLIFERA